MREKRGRGRPKLSDSPTIERTYLISKQDYQSFLEWCESRGLKPTEVIRGLILKTAKTSIRDLVFSNKEFEKLARQLLFEKLRKEMKLK